MQNTISRYRSDDEAHMADIGIRVKRNVLREDFPLHTHDFHETFLIVSGSANHVLGEREYPLGRGDGGFYSGVTGARQRSALSGHPDAFHGACQLSGLRRTSVRV